MNDGEHVEKLALVMTRFGQVELGLGLGSRRSVRLVSYMTGGEKRNGFFDGEGSHLVAAALEVASKPSVNKANCEKERDCQLEKS